MKLTVPANFDSQAYLNLYPHVRYLSMSATEHYTIFGARLGYLAPVLESGYLVSVEQSENKDELRDSIDPDFYYACYPDVRAVGADAATHYIRVGWREGRNPNNWFDTRFYLDENPDVHESGMNPLEHFLRSGKHEGRIPAPRREALIDNEADFFSYKKRFNKISAINRGIGKDFYKGKMVAYYLPQYHPIPENNTWWGENFTEWHNVARARPQFSGHYQPHLPSDLGFYNLLDGKTLEAQSKIAFSNGVDAFCFYFYWFSGKTLLEDPIDIFSKLDSIKTEFCLCWANENWTRTWDGLNNNVLIGQAHSPEDDIAFISHISIYLKNPRYLRICGKPLLLVYRPSLLPSMKATAERWRSWCRQNGVGEIYICMTLSFDLDNPSDFGLDAAVEFPPNNLGVPELQEEPQKFNPNFTGKLYDWNYLVERSYNYPTVPYKVYRGINPGWDNEARRPGRGTVLYGDSPERYQTWLLNAYSYAENNAAHDDECLVFVNAWNEWAEGAHLEPDQARGYAYLEANRVARLRFAISKSSKRKEFESVENICFIIHVFYIDVFHEILSLMSEGLLRHSFYITCGPDLEHLVLDVLHSFKVVNFRIILVNNHGRDVLPFFEALDVAVKDGKDAIVKLHTKKSLHRSDGASWRNEIYSALCNENWLECAREAFRRDPSCGIIGPESCLVSMGAFWGSNFENTMQIASRLGFELDEDTIGRYCFVAGTMFIARVSALLPILSLAIGEDDFPVEQGQVDGTMAHAIERALTFSAASVGMCVSSGFFDKEGDFKMKAYPIVDFSYAARVVAS